MSTDGRIRRSVEARHVCRANVARLVPVHERFQGYAVWDGLVNVCDLVSHPKVTRAYDWSIPIEGSYKRWLSAAGQLGAIRTPLDAVEAAKVAQHRMSPDE